MASDEAVMRFIDTVTLEEVSEMPYHLRAWLYSIHRALNGDGEGVAESALVQSRAWAGAFWALLEATPSARAAVREVWRVRMGRPSDEAVMCFINKAQLGGHMGVWLDSIRRRMSSGTIYRAVRGESRALAKAVWALQAAAPGVRREACSVWHPQAYQPKARRAAKPARTPARRHAG